MSVVSAGDYICSQNRRAAAEVSDEGDDLECAKVTVSSRHDRGPCTDAISAMPAALHSGVEVRLDNTLPNLPFIDAYDGVVSRRAVLKVSTIF